MPLWVCMGACRDLATDDIAVANVRDDLPELLQLCCLQQATSLTQRTQ